MSDIRITVVTMTQPPAPKRKPSLSAQLVENLRQHIASGAWPVGTRLPGEHELVEQLGVSRTTLREALGALTHLGLLEARAGDGTYVRASSELEAVLMRRAASSPRDDVFELRALLEAYGSGLAAKRRSEQDVTRLRELLVEADAVAATKSIPQIADADARFHRAVITASGNTLLAEIYEHLGHAITEMLGGLPVNEALQQEHQLLHHALVRAIEHGDETEARVVATHIVETTNTNQPEAAE